MEGRKYSVDDFKKPDTEPEKEYWTEEQMLAVAKKILKRLGLPEDSLYNGKMKGR